MKIKNYKKCNNIKNYAYYIVAVNLKGDNMRNFFVGDDNDIQRFNVNDTNNTSNLNRTNNDEVSFLAELLSSDNTEILLFLIIFLMLFTTFGRR